MNCEQQLKEEHVIQLLMGNINDKMQPFMCIATITTFQNLLDIVAKFEKLNLSRSESHSDKPKKAKASDARRGEVDSTFFSRAYNPNPQPKLILGGNDKPRNFQGGRERARQNVGTGDKTFPSLKKKMNKKYLFKREITSSPVPLVEEIKNKKKHIQEEQLETAISKKTAKMLKQLEGFPGVKWKSPTEPVINLKVLPVVRASTSKQCSSQTGSLKSGKAKSSKKKTKLKKPKEKRTTTQRIIDSLDDYYQTARHPIKLVDYMSGLRIDKAKEADEDPLPTETCRVILVMPVTPMKEKYAEQIYVETCMVASSMDYSSEEDLYFPREAESEHDIASQMGHVNLGGDSENESLDAVMADSEEDILSNGSEPDEIAQVQLRSGKVLPPPPKKGRPEKEREKKQVGRKKASLTLPKVAIVPKERKHVPHLSSDTYEDDITPTKSQRVCQPTAKRRKEVEYSNSDYDYASIYTNIVLCVFSRRIDSLTISDSVLIVTRIPLQYFKEIIPREVHKIKELTTCYLSPLKKGTKPENIFYFVGKHEEENRDWCYRLVDSEELFPTRLPRFNTRGIQGMLRKQINIPTSKVQLRTCLGLWYERNPRLL
ncbi:hypothetical protein M5K25_024790 [Dendrobium thyrsiflorum]|uniref:Uncharacterized protein n=1 Tax=Dendrobium thyrsiflorum TaxID=117978 RepID=A0ABD0U2S9_DENTH